MAENGKAKDNRQKLIEENLQRVYQEVVDEEIPDRFKDLLERLKSARTGGASDK